MLNSNKKSSARYSGTTSYQIEAILDLFLFPLDGSSAVNRPFWMKQTSSVFFALE
jgi:hypothetical protein